MNTTNNKRNSGKLSRESIEREISKLLKRPSDFSYSGDLPLFDSWVLGPVIETRDSTLLDQSNSAILWERLKAQSEYNDQWDIVHCSHWAVGWCDHLAYKLFEEIPVLHTTIKHKTPIAEYIEETYRKMREEYPILDEEDYSSREYAATLENIIDSVRYFCRKNDIDPDSLPEEYASKLHSWFWDNDQSAVENIDDRGGYPSDSQLTEAFLDLGWYTPEETNID